VKHPAAQAATAGMRGWRQSRASQEAPFESDPNFPISSGLGPKKCHSSLTLISLPFSAQSHASGDSGIIVSGPGMVSK
jgi:hypothetical protein